MYYQPQAAPVMVSNVNVNVQGKSGPDFVARALYFCFIGWWLGFFWLQIGFGLCVLIVTLPLGLVMLNMLPTVLTLRPQGSQMALLRLYTHSILLLRKDEPEAMRNWQGLVTESCLIPLASILSRREGASTITALAPVLEGVLTRLERGKDVHVDGMLFHLLVDRIAMLFESYAPQELERSAFDQAPDEALDLATALQQFDPTATKWRPEMLSPFLDGLPEGAVAIYGAGPNWLYAGIAAHTNGYPLSHYDPRHDFGWRQPIPVCIGDQAHPDVHIEVHNLAHCTLLSIEIPSKHLEYFQPEALCFPPVAVDKGLVISGPLPFWLLTALVCLYKEAGIPWIAPYHVPLQSAIVVYSRTADHSPGEVMHVNIV